MPLYRCDQCNCVENTALTHYWSRNRRTDTRALCSACDPEINHWHGRFPRRSASGMHIDQSGHLWTQEQVASGKLPDGFIIVGQVP